MIVKAVAVVLTQLSVSDGTAPEEPKPLFCEIGTWGLKFLNLGEVPECASNQ